MIEEEPGEVEQTTKLWSEFSTWEDTLGRYPTTGDSIVIPNDWHIILDQSTPELGYL